jgi:hypothetical protein
MFLMKDWKSEKNNIDITEDDKILILLNTAILCMALIKLLEFMRAHKST